ncbi:prepilin-type N-terminal cleavage/methylation domain-containing protein, partial [candidate division WOR-3 bacterium]|nr:prepilin-type N-terminal cleavage/methylation domain-containing protein [candidate division WOR-3 bacterium]
MYEKIIISRKNGYSLVSVMVASLILGIGIVS